MNGQDYPLQHFQQMTDFAEQLKTLPAQIEEHEYLYSAFGCWGTIIRYKGFAFSVSFDGREGEYSMSRSRLRNSACPYEWEEPFWRRPAATHTPIPTAEIIAAMKAALA